LGRYRQKCPSHSSPHRPPIICLGCRISSAVHVRWAPPR